MTNLKTLLGALAAAALIATAPYAAANLGATDESQSDDPNFQQGLKALEAQEWGKAIDLLDKAAAADPDNADFHNLLGYANRKAGNLDKAFEHYKQALKLNPKHRHAHEYIGEAYLMAGDVGMAQKHLTELQRLCSPIPCEELRELRRAIDAYQKSN
ncbi:MAG: tetratricopeptide repeat protein [Burkholderiales bacterium]